jgi:hypothetical protein
MTLDHCVHLYETVQPRRNTGWRTRRFPSSLAPILLGWGSCERSGSARCPHAAEATRSGLTAWVIRSA